MEIDCKGCAAALPLLREVGEALARPVLVGIGGPGGSGKSSFAARLATHLGDARIVPLDDYRKGVADIAAFEASLCKRMKSIRLPKAPWLNFDALPSLKTMDGHVLSALAISSRAEWAVHAIALLGSEKALGALDALIHRYRSQRKYVSAAASLAIFRTAEMMGICADELAERIVPTFGFDENGERKFPIRNGHVTAVLCHDFKIAWKDGFSDKLVANPPGKLTDESEAELKNTWKFLEEAVTRQTSRLQDSMIGGRRWAVDVWLERFEKHPLFRVFAMRLVWGVYDADGKLLRTFRLYPNGLTADAAGGLEEFSGSNACIGIPHRMELDDKAAKDWSAHLRRFKVKPLFSQLDRPVHRLDPLHGNRRKIQLTMDTKTTAGTLRKELLGRGWSLSATGDGGMLSGMWRRFPGCMIEVYLPARGLHAASMKDDMVTLEAAYLARGNPAKTNDPDFPEESLAMPFDQISAIVFSETLAVLKAIIETKA